MPRPLPRGSAARRGARLAGVTLLAAHVASGSAFAQAVPGAPAPSPPAAGSPAPGAGVPPAFGTTTIAKLNLRMRPGSGRVLARLPRATRLAVGCQRTGPLAPGRSGPSRVWDRVTRPAPGAGGGAPGGTGGWVADGFLDTGTNRLVAPLCDGPVLAGAAVPGAPSGPCAISPPVALLAPFATPQALIEAALPGAAASRAAFRVPVAVTLAQTILETGGGRFTAGANNFFGLKAQATSQRGAYAYGTRAAGCVLTKTREAERGGLVVTIGAFRAYATLEQSILDHGERLTVNPAYRAAFAFTDRPRRFAQVIGRRYATDPRYAAKLLDLMDRYRLEALG